MLLDLLGGLHPAVSAEQDLLLWSLVNTHHRFNDEWGAGFQAEIRLKDNISQYDETVVKPSISYFFSDNLFVALGYKYENKWHKADEQVIWQEIFLKQELPELAFTHQVRLEERFIDGIPGTIPRLRYLLHASYPLESNMYLAVSEAVRFNLDNKGTGPVSGFEQNRLYGGLGFELTENVRLEFGYLWRFQRERVGPHSSDHALRFQVLINSDGRD